MAKKTQSENGDTSREETTPSPLEALKADAAASLAKAIATLTEIGKITAEHTCGHIAANLNRISNTINGID